MTSQHGFYNNNKGSNVRRILIEERSVLGNVKGRTACEHFVKPKASTYRRVRARWSTYISHPDFSHRVNFGQIGLNRAKMAILGKMVWVPDVRERVVQGRNVCQSAIQISYSVLCLLSRETTAFVSGCRFRLCNEKIQYELYKKSR